MKTGKGLLEISEQATELVDEKREAAETTGTRSGRKYKETYKRAKIMPLLVEGHRAEICAMGRKYVETLKSKLPSLRDGANRWIAAFEDETVGDMIAVGRH